MTPVLAVGVAGDQDLEGDLEEDRRSLLLAPRFAAPEKLGLYRGVATYDHVSKTRQQVATSVEPHGKEVLSI